ncbi:MAG: DNA methyltransferase, partial [Nitrospirae bacterium RBG_13_41_22]
MLKSYLKRIFGVAKRGDAREESYYSCLEGLLKNYADSINKKQIHVTTLPKKTDAGNPDFRVWDGKQSIVGYIEAKKHTEENLLEIEHTEQLKRYLKTFPNLILTNFFEFRLYRDGHLIDKVQIARPYVIHKLGTIPPVEKEQDFLNLLERFFSFSLPKTFTAKTLAIELAKRTRFLKEQVVIEELKEEERKGRGFILGFYEVFSKYLISGLSKEDFADLYSQTITYGLFAARTRTENGFNRKLAYDRIPRTIGILRDVFKFISLGDLPQQMEWIIDDISEILAVTDVSKILDEYFHKHKGKDPIVHFYETFLAEYDPKTREKRGVYYTPEPVVSYIVRSIQLILKSHFDKMDGFADSGVTVLDPAAGTLTFLAEAAKLAVEKFTSNYGDGAKEMFIKEHILKNFYAFELMMAPYAIGHLKMSFLLEELGYKLQADDRFKLYLTNTLEMEELAQTELPGMASLSEESHLAGEVKKEMPILAIIGNPPYSGHSTNIGEWISNEIKAYFQVDGKPLGEKNPKWLQDDYVKFIRFSQWKIEQSGGGVLGFITNHSYLDNPTFRGMRQSLMHSFDELYLLDLHGNSLKKEKCPDGSKDENVFDIQQGVAIALFIKRLEKKEEPLYPFRPSPQMSIGFEKVEEEKEKPKKHKCKVHHFDVWGNRGFKYDWLSSNDIKTTKWIKIKPKSEFYLFIPRDEGLFKQYSTYPKITDIFPVNSVGIVTARDNLTIKWSRGEMWQAVLNFSKLDTELARQAYNLGNDVRDWKVELAQKDLKDSGMDKKKIVPILYRPFDIRYTYYTGKSRGFHCMPRPEVMHHMTKDNLALCVGRAGQVVGLEKPWNIVFSSNHIEDFNLFYRGGNVNFPLYLYIDTTKTVKSKSWSSALMLFEPGVPYTIKKLNISESIIQMVSSTYKRQPAPEEIFFYIYAVLYSNTYRTKYAEFLKIDFPRIPFTKDYKLFKKMGEHGERLVDLHLMKAPDIEPPIVSFHGKGDNRVEKLRYEQEKLFINNDQYFEGIAPEVWEYQIGGYQVCDKWLKDRKGRILSLDDIKHYCGIVTA